VGGAGVAAESGVKTGISRFDEGGLKIDEGGLKIESA
jgi:hypothetical protein